MVEPVSQEVKAQIAVLFARGASPFDIRMATGVNRHVVHRQMRLLARPPKPVPARSALRFSLVEREEISRGLAAGVSLRAIAAGLGRAPSSVTREVGRNGGRRRYRACRADHDAVRRTRRPKPAKLAACARLRLVVEAKLELDWSPQQISAWLVGEYPSDLEMRVSHETIYLSL